MTWIRSAALLLACALPVAAARADQAAEPTPELSIGVAPFQPNAPTGGEVPEMGERLAAALAVLGVAEIVGPEALGALGVAEPTAELVREVAAQTGVDAVVVGRTTRLGGRLSVDVRLRSGRTGAVAGTYVAEISPSEPPEPVLKALAEQVVSGARAALGAEVRAPRLAREPAEPPPPAPAQAPEPEAERVPFGLDALGGGAPLTIRSDELEATEKDGARTLTFRNRVEVRRGDLTLRADRLTAFYPPDAKQPRELSAQGGVTVKQGSRAARCDRAVYERENERIQCRGNAELRDDEDRIRGERITFDLAQRRVSVEDDVQLSLQPRAAKAPNDASSAAAAASSDELSTLQSGAPISIRAERLDASDRDGRRAIRFEGGVEVVRSDVVLRSQVLEALYPEGARQPERLVATGEVTLTQGTREARCERAVYHQGAQRVECVGQAELRDGEDRVRGEMIAFDLDAETVVVTGGTRLFFRPGGETQGTALP